ncbi:Prenylated Rab acceptor protein 1 [Tilletia horrida]|nr:Prenylated Rab acceptor protein 1 [Tilletia horrida]
MLASASALLFGLLSASAASAAAVPRSTELAVNNPAEAILARALGDKNGEYRKDFPIHESCNASQTLQLRRGFDDMARLLQSARDHLLHHGNSSELFKTYFGAGADPATPLGIYERLLEGDKTGTLFRCDDPDRNCATQDGWNGHWRGSNATGETVICELTFHTRRNLESACGLGFQLARDNVNIYFATDLTHRAMHLPSMTNELVVHAADEMADVLELAKTNVSFSVRNQHSIQNFAFEVYTRENIVEEGCVGEILPAEHDDHDHSSTTASGIATATATATATASGSTAAASAPAQTDPAAAKDCHTHADGTVHCV